MTGGAAVGKYTREEVLLEQIEALKEQVAYLYNGLSAKEKAFRQPSTFSALRDAYIRLGFTQTAEGHARRDMENYTEERG